MNPLSGITVIDFTRLLPGPLATNLMGLMGARVIRVERPGKPDAVRHQPPMKGGTSRLFFNLNYKKEIRRIDYTSETGRAEVLDLIAGADLLVEQFRPGVMAGWGLDYASVKKRNQKLIYLSISGYGQDGPYRDRAGHDLNYLAHAGILSLMRDRNGRPVIPGIQIADISSGSYLGLAACTAALFQRERTGRGCHIDLSMLDGLMPLLSLPLTQSWGGMEPEEINLLSGALVNYKVYRCSDDEWVALGALEMKFWNRFCRAVKREDWQRDHQLELSVQVFPVAEIEALFRSRSREEWCRWAADKDICLSPVNRISEIEDDPQIAHRGLTGYETADGMDGQKAIRNPIKFKP